MDLIVKHFNELSTTELYEILKTRFEIFVLTIKNYSDQKAGDCFAFKTDEILCIYNRREQLH